MQIENVKTKFLTWKYLNMSKDLTSQHYFLFMAYRNMTSYMSTGSLKMKKNWNNSYDLISTTEFQQRAWFIIFEEPSYKNDL